MSFSSSPCDISMKLGLLDIVYQYLIENKRIITEYEILFQERIHHKISYIELSTRFLFGVFRERHTQVSHILYISISKNSQIMQDQDLQLLFQYLPLNPCEP